jgi:transcription elongation factor Elf1
MNDATKITCPYCGSERVSELTPAEKEKFHQMYRCDECEWMFDAEDIKWEELRHAISHRLIDTDEEHPMEFEPNDEIVIGENWDETCGLSTLELPSIDKIFQIPGDGTIWFHINGEFEDIDRTIPVWHNIDEPGYLILDDLQAILDGIIWATERK